MDQKFKTLRNTFHFYDRQCLETVLLTLAGGEELMKHASRLAPKGDELWQTMIYFPLAAVSSALKYAGVLLARGVQTNDVPNLCTLKNFVIDPENIEISPDDKQRIQQLWALILGIWGPKSNLNGKKRQKCDEWLFNIWGQKLNGDLYSCLFEFRNQEAAHPNLERDEFTSSYVPNKELVILVLTMLAARVKMTELMGGAYIPVQIRKLTTDFRNVKLGSVIGFSGSFQDLVERLMEKMPYL